MNQELELELTFLAKRLPEEIIGVDPIRITDVYIPFSAKHACLRLRQKGEKYEITKKIPVKEGDSSEQIEQTISLSRDEFLTLAKCEGKKVVKDRYKVMIQGRRAEVDVFREELVGLVLMDFEFKNRDEKANFMMPEVALADVTQEDFVAGGILAGKKYEDIIGELEKFGYRKIESRRA